MNNYLLPAAVVAGLVSLVQIALLVRLVRLGRDLCAYDERSAHLSDALSLLTETTEASFRAVALEIERQAAIGAGRVASRASTRRVAAAARRGRSIQDIAATEKVSEGEVRLRLHLAEDRPTERAPQAGVPRPNGAGEFAASA